LSLIRRLVFGDNPGRTLTRIIVLAVVCFITFRWVLVPIRTEGTSMLPTYETDRLNLVNRLAYLGAAPQRGDVVAIRMAGPNVLYVKRVIGLPGERVSFVDGIVNINGRPLPEPYVRHRGPWKVEEVTVGTNEYFVIGDNRGMAAGEHDFGRVDISRILGKVVF
jgi:signal peptidase I